MVGDELVGGEALTERERGELGVAIAAGRAQVSHELGIVGGAGGSDRVEFVQSGGDEVGDGRAVAAPPGAELALHVFDRVEIVIGEQHLPGDGIRRD